MKKQKYLCVQRSQSGKCEDPSPSDMQQMFAAFNAWKDKYKDNLIDMGGKLGEEGKVVSSASSDDGPFAETKEIIGGYMIISADSMEEAMQVVQESPGVMMPGSSVEIRPIVTP